MAKQFCGECGAEAQGDAKFCAKCGKPVAVKPAEVVPVTGGACCGGAGPASTTATGTPAWLWVIIGLVIVGGLILIMMVIPEKKVEVPLTEEQKNAIFNDLEPDPVNLDAIYDTGADNTLERINNQPLIVPEK